MRRCRRWWPDCAKHFTLAMLRSLDSQASAIGLPGGTLSEQVRQKNRAEIERDERDAHRDLTRHVGRSDESAHDERDQDEPSAETNELEIVDEPRNREKKNDYWKLEHQSERHQHLGHEVEILPHHHDGTYLEAGLMRRRGEPEKVAECNRKSDAPAEQASPNEQKRRRRHERNGDLLFF